MAECLALLPSLLPPLFILPCASVAAFCNAFSAKCGFKPPSPHLIKHLSLKHLSTPFLTPWEPLVGIMYGFKHGQNETTAFNLKPAEDLKDSFAFVQGAVVQYVVPTRPCI
ncbi:hypothetical protein B0H13DRAFT_2083566 [Mycena leptocephala]|nr:hypothetical protein B0H13DRAFT_2083566 [Mycena leptocephala]